MALFDLEKLCVEDENLKVIRLTALTTKHIPLPVSVLTNLKQRLVCFYDPNLRELASSSIDALYIIAAHFKYQKVVSFDLFQTAIGSKVALVLEALNQGLDDSFGIEADYFREIFEKVAT